MSDDEQNIDTTFDATDAGASKTFPMQAGSIRKNGFIAIKGRACKVADVSTSKTGKHGHAKCHFVGIDIFSGKKYEELVPSSHNCEVPNVVRTEYSLIDVNAEAFVSLMTQDGEIREDLSLPNGADGDNVLAEQIKNDFGDGKELIITVVAAMGEEKIVSAKVSNQTD